MNEESHLDLLNQGTMNFHLSHRLAGSLPNDNLRMFSSIEMSSAKIEPAENNVRSNTYELIKSVGSKPVHTLMKSLRLDVAL